MSYNICIHLIQVNICKINEFLINKKKKSQSFKIISADLIVVCTYIVINCSFCEKMAMFCLSLELILLNILPIKGRKLQHIYERPKICIKQTFQAKVYFTTIFSINYIPIITIQEPWRTRTTSPNLPIIYKRSLFFLIFPFVPRVIVEYKFDGLI